MYILTVTRGPDEGQRFPLVPGKQYTLGSDDGDSITLTDPMVLGGHCVVAVAKDGRVLLQNQTASAGTFVGEKKISKGLLKPPMGFRIGETTLQLREAPKGAGNGGTGGGAPTPPKTRRPEAETDHLIGKIIGGYKLIEVVGRGGMGTVYRATQLSLHRDVALKVLAPKLAKDKSFVDLFINEARAAAQLVDPNIVQVYDAGTEGDVSYFSMEFIGKGSVEEILARDKQIAWEEGILMVLEAAHGLLYAENKGIVHRDIKPDNLMLNEDGRIKIADLGLAKRGEGPKDEGIIGTPHFIPPEQALGKDVDTRADIYSLGATFFRMITGRTLFSGKTAKEIVLKHIKEPPPAASSVRKGVPDDLDMVLAKMLAKDPNQRYANARELISALEEVCAHHGIKGSIIKKGVPKRVLVAVGVLLVGAVWVAIHFATQDPVQLVDKDAIAKAKQERLAREAAEAKSRENARLRRRVEAERGLQDLNIARLELNGQVPLKSVYDDEDPAKTAAREQKWLEMAEEYEAWAEGELAPDFEEELRLATKAKTQAKKIRTTLQTLKKNILEKRRQVDEQVTKAKAIDAKQRLALATHLRERRYELAHNFCARLGAENANEQKNDPFRAVLDWEWKDPDNAENNQKATETEKIMSVVSKARGYFADELKLIAEKAAGDWRAMQASIPENPAAVEAEKVREVIDELKEVQSRFVIAPEEFDADKSLIRVDAIRDLARKAADAHGDLESFLAKQRSEALAFDRGLVRDQLRKFRTLDPNTMHPNYVMNCEYAEAINRYNQVLTQAKTDEYKAFLRERIRALRWMQFLFAQFRRDTAAADKAGRGGGGPFVNLDSEWPTDRRPFEFKFEAVDEDQGPYEFKINKRWKSEGDEFAFKDRTMDWVHRFAFHTPKGELRWKDPSPALRFALGLFCFETMQFAAAKEHFDALADDGVHGAAATHLGARAAREMEAMRTFFTYVEVLQEDQKTAAEVQQAKKQVENFAQEFGDTLFYLDVMKTNGPVERDFFATGAPELAAPPAQPPAPPKKDD